jgi:hypothetical protein
MMRISAISWGRKCGNTLCLLFETYAVFGCAGEPSPAGGKREFAVFTGKPSRFMLKNKPCAAAGFANRLKFIAFQALKR